MKKKLTESEIKKWRGILFEKFGTYAFTMTDEQIQAVYEKVDDKSGQYPYQISRGRQPFSDISRSGDV